MSSCCTLSKGPGSFPDPLMLAAWAAYGFSRFLLGPLTPAAWQPARHWFQDCLLVPALLPPVLWGLGWLGLRGRDLPPGWPEILLHTAWWSFFFEFLGPHYLQKGTADPLDVAAYFLGAFLSGLIWRRRVSTLPAPATDCR